jgi:hypothetical protein
VEENCLFLAVVMQWQCGQAIGLDPISAASYFLLTSVLPSSLLVVISFYELKHIKIANPLETDSSLST